MTIIFRNRTIFWDISKWNRGQKKMGRREYYFNKLYVKIETRMLGEFVKLDGKIDKVDFGDIK